ncbi:hypothetical protein LCI18_014419 [Fusarium solani-melongenae]|uniref:Uncharacterized protein n=1 Tax=Fusarium solani subsp. cucurbitae TaxID=2747967 RepID=A0ACD3ZQ81_FUSSC|nr:hypothetical protein LCI18_014419 [Fusarium solani-melongenae]
MAEAPPIPRPLPPGPEEQEHYYFGLYSRPKLVARSSRKPWSWQYDGWSIKKRLGTVGEHAIIEPWNDSESSLRRQILQAVQELDWTAIDVLRIGYERKNNETGEEFDNPVTLLISVKIGSGDFEDAYDAVVTCCQILESHELGDVQVEIKESEVARATSIPLPAPDLPAPDPATLNAPTQSSAAPGQATLKFSSGPLDEPTAISADTSEFLGVSIASSAAPTREGTKCLYLRHGEKIFALTCRHVVFPHAYPNVEYRHDQTKTSYTIMQPGNATLERHITKLSKGIDGHDSSIKNMEGEPWVPQAAIDREKAAKAVLETTRENLIKWDDPAVRVFGHLEFSPPFGLGPISGLDNRRLRDWALIELHQDKYATSLLSLSNLMPIGWHTNNDVLRDTLGWKNITRLLEFKGDTVQIRGIIPESELRRPKSSSPRDDLAIFVMKYGSTTGLRSGRTNGAISVVRMPPGYQGKSEEWCILGCGQGFAYQCFSAEGDSGSCIFDLQGRVGGMLTGGGGIGECGGLDVSYATPMEWLLEDMKRYGYDLELV